MPERLPSPLASTEALVEICCSPEAETSLLAQVERARQTYLKALALVHAAESELTAAERVAEDCKALVDEIEALARRAGVLPAQDARPN